MYLKKTVRCSFYVIEVDKSQIRAACIVPVYADRNDEDKFWLMRVVDVSVKNVTGIWFNKIGIRSYGVGSQGKIKWKNIVRPRKAIQSLYNIKFNNTNGNYIISIEADDYLNSLSSW